MTMGLSDKKRMTAWAIERFCRELPAPKYDVRIVFPGGKAWPREWTGPQLRSAEVVGFLRARNTQDDAAIYIRPISARYVLVDFDDDGYERLRRMVEDGVPIRYSVETSPYHVQVWVDIGRKATKEQQAEMARSFASTYGGDMRSAKADQLGRAPGFFNRKPQHLNDEGHYPRVQAIPHKLKVLISEPRNVPPSVPVAPQPSLARRAARGTCANAMIVDGDLEEWIDSLDASRNDAGPREVVANGVTVVEFDKTPDLGTTRTAYARALECMEAQGYQPKRRDDGEVDRSRQDFQVARYILMCGYSVDFATAAIACGSDKAAERGGQSRYVYAFNTACSAQKSLERYRSHHVNSQRPYKST